MQEFGYLIPARTSIFIDLFKIFLVSTGRDCMWDENAVGGQPNIKRKKV